MTTIPSSADTDEVNLLQAVMNRSQGGCYICLWPVDIDAARRADQVQGFEMREARFKLLARPVFGPLLAQFVAVCPECEGSRLLAHADVGEVQALETVLMDGKVVRRDYTFV